MPETIPPAPESPDSVAESFHPVRAVRVSEKIVDQVRQLMAAGVLKAGDRLPAERELARLLGVGRTSIREALRVMESLGMLESRSGAGTYLAPSQAVRLLITAGPFTASDRQRLVLEARLILEPELAALAARRATPGQIARLREVLGEQEADVAQGGGGLTANLQFHTALSEAAGNPVLQVLRQSLHDVLWESRERLVSRKAAESLAQHRRILRAVEAGDAAAARRAMLEHIQHTWQGFSAGGA